MFDFWNREYDVLVATTIIESGLDLPQVNTLIVERADRLGLAQLYQLRGRVGRSSQRAYAYLFHPRGEATLRGCLSAGSKRSVSSPTSAPGSSWPCAISRFAGPARCSARSSPDTSPRSGSTLYIELVAEAVTELQGRAADSEEAARGPHRPAGRCPSPRRLRAGCSRPGSRHTASSPPPPKARPSRRCGGRMGRPIRYSARPAAQHSWRWPGSGRSHPRRPDPRFVQVRDEVRISPVVLQGIPGGAAAASGVPIGGARRCPVHFPAPKEDLVATSARTSFVQCGRPGHMRLFVGQTILPETSGCWHRAALAVLMASCSSADVLRDREWRANLRERHPESSPGLHGG